MVFAESEVLVLTDDSILGIMVEVYSSAVVVTIVLGIMVLGMVLGVMVLGIMVTGIMMLGIMVLEGKERDSVGARDDVSTPPGG